MQITIDLKELQDYEKACNDRIKDIVLYTMQYSPGPSDPRNRATISPLEAARIRAGLEQAFLKFPYAILIPTVAAVPGLTRVV